MQTPSSPAVLRVAAALLLLELLSCGNDGTSPTLPPDVGVAGDGNLNETLAYIRSATGLPALAAVLVSGSEVIETGAVGQRAVGFAEQVTAADRWHLGSLTKAMTATVAAVLVDRGTISWNTTIGDVFPDLVEGAQPQYVGVTLEQLLHHTGGLPVDVGRAPSWPSLRSDSTPLIEQRRRVIGELLALAPEAPVGTYLYSNAGYIVAGGMLEAVAGELWEDLVRSELFAPLGMDSSGFGAPGSANGRTEPWGHVRQGRSWVPVPPGPSADNPAVMGPAGTVHSTLADYAQFMAAHLAGARGADGLVSAAGFSTLHTVAPGTDYALGWGVTEREWAGGRVLTHSGSNTLWWATVWIAPARNFAMLAVTNAGGDDAFHGTDAAIQALIRRFDAARGAVAGTRSNAH